MPNTPDPTITAEAETLDRLEALEAKLPATPWKLWTSCSFRRITGPDGKEGGVLHAYNQRGDGHPDLSMPEDQLQALVDIRNALPELFALSRRALASGGGGDGPLVCVTDVARALDATVEYLTGAEKIEDEPTFEDGAVVLMTGLRAVGYHIVPLSAAHQPPEPKPTPEAYGAVRADRRHGPAPDHAELVAEAREAVKGGCYRPAFAMPSALYLINRLADALASAPSGEVETK